MARKGRESFLVVGVGHPGRGDDAAGLAVARAVRKASPFAEVFESGFDAGPLLEGFSGREVVVLLDATEPAGSPGRIRRFDAMRAPLPADTFRSRETHAIGVVEAVERARLLGLLPGKKLVVVAIEGARFGYGEGLSPQVEKAIPEAARVALAELPAAGV